MITNRIIDISNINKLRSRRYNWITPKWKVKKIDTIVNRAFNHYTIRLESDRKVGELVIDKIIKDSSSLEVDCITIYFKCTDMTNSKIYKREVELLDVKDFNTFKTLLSDFITNVENH